MRSKSIPAKEPHPIRAYRDRRALSLREFGDAVGISQAALCRIEAGQVEMPNISIIARMALATRGEVSEIDIFRYHCAAATGIVPSLRAPMTINFNWSWVRPRAEAQRASASA